MDDGDGRKGLGDRAYDLMKRDIVWCRLAPGTSVSEAHLAARYDLGKAPVRHALSRLVQEGYVQSIPRRGHIISPVTLQSVRDIFDMRLLLEPAAVEAACGRVDGGRLRALDAACARNYTPGDIESEARFMAANRRFHMEIVRAAGNARLTAAIDQILEEMMRLLHLGFVIRERPEAFLAEHDGLIAAVVGNRPADARAMTAEHIESVRGLVIDGIISHTTLSDANIAPVPDPVPAPTPTGAAAS